MEENLLEGARGQISSDLKIDLDVHDTRVNFVKVIGG